MEVYNLDLMKELYKVYRAEMNDGHRQMSTTLQIYLTIVITILGFTIAAVIKVNDHNEIVLSHGLLLIGPIINWRLCNQANEICKRHYRVMIERLTVVMKIEEIFGLHNMSYSVPENLGKDSREILFQEDKWLFPNRWRKPKGETTEEFIEDQMNSGIMPHINLTFKLVRRFNVFLGLVLVAYMCYYFYTCISIYFS